MRQQAFIFSSFIGFVLFLSLINDAYSQSSEVDATVFNRIEHPLSTRIGVTATGIGLISLELWWFLVKKRYEG